MLVQRVAGPPGLLRALPASCFSASMSLEISSSPHGAWSGGSCVLILAPEGSARLMQHLLPAAAEHVEGSLTLAGGHTPMLQRSPVEGMLCNAHAEWLGC